MCLLFWYRRVLRGVLRSRGAWQPSGSWTQDRRVEGCHQGRNQASRDRRVLGSRRCWGGSRVPGVPSSTSCQLHPCCRTCRRGAPDAPATPFRGVTLHTDMGKRRLGGPYAPCDWPYRPLDSLTGEFTGPSRRGGAIRPTHARQRPRAGAAVLNQRPPRRACCASRYLAYMSSAGARGVPAWMESVMIPGCSPALDGRGGGAFLPRASTCRRGSTLVSSCSSSSAMCVAGGAGRRRGIPASRASRTLLPPW